MMRALAPLAIALALPGWAMAAWQVELNNPANGLYEKDAPAFATVRWEGDAAPDASPGFALYDHRDQKVAELTAEKDGAGWRVLLPTARMGYYEVRALGSEPGKVIPAQGSRPAGKLPFAVVAKINPNPSYDFTQGFLGLQGTSITRQRDGQAYGWDPYPYLGIQTIGVGYHWHKLEPTGPGDFEKNIAEDRQPQWVRELKVVPYFHLNGFPMWAVDPARLPENERDGTSTQRVPPKDWALWEAYLEKVIPYIVKQYDFLPERVYEVMWEPVIPWGWYGTPEEIAKTHEIAQKVIRKYDPQGRVAGPTLSGLNDVEYYETLLKAGVGESLDVVSFHPYKGYPPEKSAIPEALDRIEDLTKQYTGKEMPFIGTEYGFPDVVTNGTLNQGYGLTASVLIFKGEGAAKQTLFYLADYAGEPGYGMFYNLGEKLTFGPARIAPKEGVPMVRAAIDQIGNADVVGKLDYLGPEIYGYVFKDRAGGELLAALWDGSDADREITLDTGVDEVTVYDAFGNAEKRATEDGRVRVKLARSPVYIRGLSGQLYGPGRIAPLLETAQVWKLYRGREARETVKFTKDVSTEEVKVIFDTAAAIYRGQFREAAVAKEGGTMDITFPVAKDAPLGMAAGYIRITQVGKPLYRGVQRVEVLPELAISPLTATQKAGKWQVGTTLRNTSPYAWKGQAALTVEGKTVKSPEIALASGAEKRVDLTVAATEAGHKVPAEFVVTSAEGTQLTRKDELTFLSIPRRPAGENFWAKLKKTPLDAESLWRAHTDSAHKGPQDLSAAIAYAWDDENLYVLVDVADDVHRQGREAGTTWAEDSVQLAFDIKPSREQNTNLLAEKNERTNSEWTLAFTSRGPEVYLSIAPGKSPLAENSVITAEGVKLEGGPDKGRTLYKFTLPWKALDPAGLRQGGQIGLAAAINDSDREGEPNDRRALRLFEGILKSKNPAEFGSAQLRKAD